MTIIERVGKGIDGLYDLCEYIKNSREDQLFWLGGKLDFFLACQIGLLEVVKYFPRSLSPRELDRGFNLSCGEGKLHISTYLNTSWGTVGSETTIMGGICKASEKGFKDVVTYLLYEISHISSLDGCLQQ